MTHGTQLCCELLDSSHQLISMEAFKYLHKSLGSYWQAQFASELPKTTDIKRFHLYLNAF